MSNSKLITSYIDALEGQGSKIMWRSIDNLPDREGYVVVATFDEFGKITGVSDDYIYVKGQKSIMCNSMYDPRCYGNPTHYMMKDDFIKFLGIAPREDKNGGLVI